ncbi:hypothetical protein ABNQ38_31875 [Azospirillum sp. A29]|uniref:hypothetical protein n=1 Tax=Azospirillum sp. A29 TaxID=3160606 RepID=UPI00366C343A
MASTIRKSSPPHCTNCNKPVLLGQPRWAGDPNDRLWHYACAEAAGFTCSAEDSPFNWRALGLLPQFSAVL